MNFQGLLSSCGFFSLAVMFGLLSSGGRVLIVAMDSKLVAVFTGLSRCSGGRGLFVLVVVDSSLFVSGGTYQFAVGAWAPLKGDSESC